MINRPEATFQLMDDLNASAVPDLVDQNMSAFKLASWTVERKFPDAPDTLELQLVPDYMRINNGYMVYDTEEQRKIGEKVLARLHRRWKGGEVIENKIKDGLTERYWEFVHGFTLWTVVEQHYETSEFDLPAVRGHLVSDVRPADYQKLLTRSFNKEEKVTEETSQTLPITSETDRRRTKKSHRVGKAITNWLNNQAKQPPRPGRL